MMEQDKLESIYDDPVWKEEERERAFNKLEKRLWRIAIGMFAFLIVLGTGLAMYDMGPAAIVLGLLGAVTGVVVFSIPVVILAYLLAIIPHKHYDFSSRVFVWIPFLVTICMGLVMLCIGFMIVDIAFNRT